MVEKDKPLITFAIITFNQERFIIDAIRGALAQTYSPLEVIISDDCSTDRTFDLILEEVSRYSGPHQVRVNRNPRNLGIGGHVNKVMEMATAEWVVIAAGDDVSHPTRTEALVSFAETDGWKSYLYCSSHRFIDETGAFLGKTSTVDIPITASLVDWVRHFDPIHSGATHMISKRLFADFGWFHASLKNEDMVNTFRALVLGGWKFLPIPLVDYRAHANNFHGPISRWRDLQTLLSVKEVRARRLVRICQQILSDIDMSYRLSYIDSRMRTRLSRWTRAKMYDNFLDYAFYRDTRIQRDRKRAVSLRNIRRLLLILMAPQGFGKALKHVTRWMLSDIYIHGIHWRAKKYGHVTTASTTPNLNRPITKSGDSDSTRL